MYVWEPAQNKRRYGNPSVESQKSNEQNVSQMNKMFHTECPTVAKAADMKSKEDEG